MIDLPRETTVEMLEGYMREEIHPSLPGPFAVVIPDEWHPGTAFPQLPESGGEQVCARLI